MQNALRLALVAILALIISLPLQLSCFSAEIQGILDDRQSTALAAIDQRYQAQIAAVEYIIEELTAATEAQLQIRERDYQAYKCECDGTCGTGKVGRGSECERKEAQYQQSNREYQEVKAHNDEQIAARQAEITALNAEVLHARQEREAAFAPGLPAKMSTIPQLPLAGRVGIPLLLFLAGSAVILLRQRRH